MDDCRRSIPPVADAYFFAGSQHGRNWEKKKIQKKENNKGLHAIQKLLMQDTNFS